MTDQKLHMKPEMSDSFYKCVDTLLANKVNGYINKAVIATRSDSELSSYVKVKVTVLGSPSLTGLKVSVH